MFTVIKRNGKKVPFNIMVIERNIKLAALESNTILKLSEIKLISAAIIDKIKKPEVHVEEIQEFVQFSLMEQGFFRIATDYIEHRNKHKIRVKKEYQFLSDAFLSKYKHLPDPFKNQLGAFVYYRTYSRYIIEEKRRER
ncbi:MAG: anaerobic ribonucleoside triphosphate reductase [Candidatus Izimaplasma bacterium HR2]|nr:MAG: anaerobic ribonucleoside triphosphate reductase [Candidatus Izimaplasma bacterium HR2]